MNAPTDALAGIAMPDQWDGVLDIPVDLVQPGQNPRKHFNADHLAELAESIKVHGVLQPIIVRCIGKQYDAEGGAIGVHDGARFVHLKHEIVAGERRWRASKAAGLGAVPAICRQLTDLQALELAVIENLQRADLHPLEEAEGYEQLLDKHGMTVDELAAKVGKSRSYVYQRMKLAALCAEARQAFYDGKLTPSTALLIARIPGAADQVKAIDLVVDHDQSPLPFRRASWNLQNRLMLDLARAPFPPEDADLVPAAGVCSACPKRTGSQPELFHDIADGDHCTDTACFNAKREACTARQLATLAAQGAKTISGKEAEKAFPVSSYSSDPKGFLQLDHPVYTDGVREPLSKILGDDRGELEIVTIEHPRTKQLIPAVRINTQLADALKAKGVAHVLPIGPTGKSAEQKKAELRTKIEAATRLRVWESIRAARTSQTAPAELSDAERRLIFETTFRGIGYDHQVQLAKLWQWSDGEESWPRWQEEIEVVLVDWLDQAHLDMALVRVLKDAQHLETDPLQWMAEVYGVDMKLIGAAVKKELTPKPKTKSGKSGKEKRDAIAADK